MIRRLWMFALVACAALAAPAGAGAAVTVGAPTGSTTAESGHPIAISWVLDNDAVAVAQLTVRLDVSEYPRSTSVLLDGVSVDATCTADWDERSRTCELGPIAADAEHSLELRFRTSTDAPSTTQNVFTKIWTDEGSGEVQGPMATTVVTYGADDPPTCTALPASTTLPFGTPVVEFPLTCTDPEGEPQRLHSNLAGLTWDGSTLRWVVPPDHLGGRTDVAALVLSAWRSRDSGATQVSTVVDMFATTAVGASLSGPSGVRAEQAITVRLTVTNAGPHPLSAARLKLVSSGAVTAAFDSQGCGNFGQEGVDTDCSIRGGVLQPGAVATVDVDVYGRDVARASAGEIGIRVESSTALDPNLNTAEPIARHSVTVTPTGATMVTRTRVRGRAMVGRTLVCMPPITRPALVARTVTYRWHATGRGVVSTSRTYRPRAAEAGMRVSCSAMGRTAWGATRVDSFGTWVLAARRHFVGSSRADRFVGDQRSNRFRTYGGNDVVIGNNGADDIDLGPGNDAATGGAGNDRIACGSGRDIVNGGDGNDRIDCRDGSGGDRVICGAGRDTAYIDVGDRTTDCDVVLRCRGTRCIRIIDPNARGSRLHRE